MAKCKVLCVQPNESKQFNKRYCQQCNKWNDRYGNISLHVIRKRKQVAEPEKRDRSVIF